MNKDAADGQSLIEQYYETCCSLKIGEELDQHSELPEFFHSREIQALIREIQAWHPPPMPHKVKNIAGLEYLRRTAQREGTRGQFGITEEVTALQYFRRKRRSGELFTAEDKVYLKELGDRVKGEQDRPEYETYATYTIDNESAGGESLEKYAFRQVFKVVEQMDSESAVGE